VEAWSTWQQVALRKAPAGAGSEPRQPRVDENGQLEFLDTSDISYYLVPEDGVYYIDSVERGSRDRYWMFRQFEDAEKYMLLLISQSTRPGTFSDSPVFRWYRAGLDPRVSLAKPDPDHFPGRVSLTVDGEPIDRGWMGETDAISFSHAIVLSYEELCTRLKDGIPADWFERKASPGVHD
jgi:hypothetical protein